MIAIRRLAALLVFNGLLCAAPLLRAQSSVFPPYNSHFRAHQHILDELLARGSLTPAEYDVALKKLLSETVFRPSEEDTPPALVHGLSVAVKPGDQAYTIAVQFVIEPNGAVGRFQVIQTTDGEAVERVLTMLAQDVFEPGVKDGQPVATLIRLYLQVPAGPAIAPPDLGLQPD